LIGAGGIYGGPEHWGRQLEVCSRAYGSRTPRWHRHVTARAYCSRARTLSVLRG